MAEKMECRVLFSTTGKELITDAKGRVLGIRVETPEGLKDLEAGAVVLATSGFQANEELLLRYHPEEFVRNIRLTGSPYSTGDGHRIAEEVGANLVGMNLLEYRTIDKTWRPGSPGQMGPFRHLNVTARYAVFVNRDGRRFIDENEENDVIAGSIMLQPDAVCAWIMDDKARRKAPEDEIARYERTRPSVVIRADTLEEMAEKIDIPYERLEKNIGEYNNAIRDEKITTLDVPKAACALQIDTPPFYAVYPVWAGLNCTLGGPKVTKKAEVVNMEKRPIPGLYAAGEMVGDYYYAYNDTTPGGIKYRRANVFVAGALLNMCLVLGRVAGTQAANYALHQ
jgi:fumarate reductase flavoprotein subunit